MHKPKIYRYQTIHDSDLLFYSPEKSGRKYISEIRHQEDKKIIFIQTPRMRIKETGSVFDFDLSATPDFVDFLKRIDEACIQTTHEKSQAWFSNEMSLEDIRDGYVSQVKGDTVSVSLLDKVEMYDSTIRHISPEEVQKQSEAVGIFKLHGLVIGKLSMSCKWTLAQLKVYDANESQLTGYCIYDSDYDSDIGVEEDDVKSPQYTPPKFVVKKKSRSKKKISS